MPGKRGKVNVNFLWFFGFWGRKFSLHLSAVVPVGLLQVTVESFWAQLSASILETTLKRNDDRKVNECFCLVHVPRLFKEQAKVERTRNHSRQHSKPVQRPKWAHTAETQDQEDRWGLHTNIPEEKSSSPRREFLTRLRWTLKAGMPVFVRDVDIQGWACDLRNDHQ